MEPPAATVISLTFESITLAWNKIRERGYSRIGFMLSRHSPQIVDDLEGEGALAILQRQLSGNEVAVPPYVGQFDDRASIKAWFKRHTPDAVAGFNSYHWVLLREMGIRIPRDIGFVNLHHDDNLRQLDSVDIGASQIPEICADHIDQSIRHKRRGIPGHRREILAPVTWLPGKSLPIKK